MHRQRTSRSTAICFLRDSIWRDTERTTFGFVVATESCHLEKPASTRHSAGTGLGFQAIRTDITSIGLSSPYRIFFALSFGFVLFLMALASLADYVVPSWFHRHDYQEYCNLVMTLLDDRESGPHK